MSHNDPRAFAGSSNRAATHDTGCLQSGVPHDPPEPTLFSPKRQFPLGTCSACHCCWPCDVTAHGKSQGNCSTDGGGEFHQIAGHPESGRAGARAGFGQQHEAGLAGCTQRKSPDARCRDRGRVDGAASRQRDHDRHDADRPGACGQAVGSRKAFREKRCLRQRFFQLIDRDRLHAPCVPRTTECRCPKAPGGLHPPGGPIAFKQR